MKKSKENYLFCLIRCITGPISKIIKIRYTFILLYNCIIILLENNKKLHDNNGKQKNSKNQNIKQTNTTRNKKLNTCNKIHKKIILKNWIYSSKK